jgi:hypothetical protein
MNLAQTLLSVGLLAVVAGSTSCSVAPPPNPDQKEILRAQWVNPNPPGSYAYFTAEPSYPKTYNIFRDPSLLARTAKENSRVLINLSLQRAIIFTNDEVAMDYPIASGKSTCPTGCASPGAASGCTRDAFRATRLPTAACACLPRLPPRSF